MTRVGRLFLLLLPLCSLPVLAQAVPAGHNATHTQSTQSNSSVEVKLGESAAELAGPWKFHTGDDMAWAKSDFDDSAWDSMDLSTPADGSLTPGWTARGYAGYSGFAWYRLRVNLEGATRSLAFKMPDSADDAYQVFVDGTRIGEFGHFSENRVTAYASQPQAYRLPKSIRNGPITIAIRMWMDSATPFNSPDAGGLRGPAQIGFASDIAAQIRLDWDDFAHDVGSGFLEMLILFMAFLMALALFALDRQEKSYLWLAIVCLVTFLVNANVLAANFTTWIGQTASVILGDVILTPMRIGLWVIFWGYWFRLWRMAKLQLIVWSLVALLAIGTAMLRPPLFGQVVPIAVQGYVVPFLLAVKLLLAVLLFIVAYRGFTRQKAEGGMAVAAVLLAAIANYQHELRLIHVQTRTSLLGFSINLGTVSTILSLLIITVMLLRRFVLAQRKKEQWKLEIQQARHVQQVLIPDKLPEIQGLYIESEYRPAREVGGDFFQILPGEAPGTALIVVGDVTGKGLQAGMLVALIVGAIRTAAQHTSDPVRILTLVNEQLCEREHASATCMILRFAPNGAITVANAGQLPPYLNGKEMEMEGALPLGIIPDAEFPVASIHLGQGDSIILMSDGIAEAQDAHGNLFGFDRVNELLSRPVTAAEIAKIAQQFGQEDDILVLRIQRTHGQKTELHAEPQLIAD
jgi:hypothetical protein